jgi:signal transduction histidine kinase
MKFPFFQKDNLFVRIFIRLLIGVTIFSILQIFFVLYTYLNDINDLGQRLLTRQATEISKSISVKNGEITHNRHHTIHEHIHNARMAFAAYTKSGKEILINGPYDLRPALMPPVNSVSSETRRDEYTESFRLKGIRRIEVDKQPIWISIIIEGKGIEPYIPVLKSEIVEHVALPIIPLSAFLLIFSVIAVRNTLLPVTKTIEQIEKIKPDDISYRLETPEHPAEVRKLALAVNDALSRIESSILSLRNFTADAAHELRTPLAIMRLEVNKLPDTENKLSLIKDVESMSRLVGQMLDVAYADALIIQDTDKVILSATAKDVISQLTPLALRSGKSIMLKDLSSQQEINGHSEAIGRAIRNVIENALFYTPEQSSVHVVIENDYVVSITDHGQGFPDTETEKILSRFKRGSLKSSHNGAGLGLAIASQIALAHNGYIKIENTPDKGAKVSIILHANASTQTPK